MFKGAPQAKLSHTPIKSEIGQSRNLKTMLDSGVSATAAKSSKPAKSKENLPPSRTGPLYKNGVLTKITSKKVFPGQSPRPDEIQLESSDGVEGAAPSPAPFAAKAPSVSATVSTSALNDDDANDGERGVRDAAKEGQDVNGPDAPRRRRKSSTTTTSGDSVSDGLQVLAEDIASLKMQEQTEQMLEPLELSEEAIAHLRTELFGPITDRLALDSLQDRPSENNPDTLQVGAQDGAESFWVTKPVAEEAGEAPAWIKSQGDLANVIQTDDLMFTYNCVRVAKIEKFYDSLPKRLQTLLDAAALPDGRPRALRKTSPRSRERSGFNRFDGDDGKDPLEANMAKYELLDEARCILLVAHLDPRSARTIAEIHEQFGDASNALEWAFHSWAFHPSASRAQYVQRLTAQCLVQSQRLSPPVLHALLEAVATEGTTPLVFAPESSRNGTFLHTSPSGSKANATAMDGRSAHKFVAATLELLESLADVQKKAAPAPSPAPLARQDSVESKPEPVEPIEEPQSPSSPRRNAWRTPSLQGILDKKDAAKAEPNSSITKAVKSKAMSGAKEENLSGNAKQAERRTSGATAGASAATAPAIAQGAASSSTPPMMQPSTLQRDPDGRVPKGGNGVDRMTRGNSKAKTGLESRPPFRVVASETLLPSEIIFEDLQVWSWSSAEIFEIPHFFELHCFGCLSHMNPCGGGPGEGAFGCSVMPHSCPVRYCSFGCFCSNLAEHQLLCQFLHTQLQPVASQTGWSSGFVLLVVRFLLRVHLSRCETREQPTSAAAASIKSNDMLVKCLLNLPNYFSETYRTRPELLAASGKLACAIAHFLPLPKLLFLSTQELHHLIILIHSHVAEVAIFDDREYLQNRVSNPLPALVFSFAVARCEHSCRPNAAVALAPKSTDISCCLPVVTVRAIAPILPQDPISVSLLRDLYQPVSVRKSLGLAASIKVIKCVCERCLSPDEGTRSLQSWRCPKCLLNWASPLLTGRQRLLTAQLRYHHGRRPPVTPSSSSASDSDSASDSGTDTEHFDLLSDAKERRRDRDLRRSAMDDRVNRIEAISGYLWECCYCGQLEDGFCRVLSTSLQRLQFKWRNLLVDDHLSRSSAGTPGASAGRKAGARSKMTDLFAQFARVLHPCHYLLFEMSCKLVGMFNENPARDASKSLFFLRLASLAANRVVEYGDAEFISLGLAWQDVGVKALRHGIDTTPTIATMPTTTTIATTTATTSGGGGGGGDGGGATLGMMSREIFDQLREPLVHALYVAAARHGPSSTISKVVLAALRKISRAARQPVLTDFEGSVRNKELLVVASSALWPGLGRLGDAEIHCLLERDPLAWWFTAARQGNLKILRMHLQDRRNLRRLLLAREVGSGCNALAIVALRSKVTAVRLLLSFAHECPEQILTVDEWGFTTVARALYHAPSESGPRDSNRDLVETLVLQTIRELIQALHNLQNVLLLGSQGLERRRLLSVFGTSRKYDLSRVNSTDGDGVEGPTGIEGIMASLSGEAGPSPERAYVVEDFVPRFLALPCVAALGSQTALHLAALRGLAVCVREMLQSGAEPDVTNSELATPLHLAALGGRADVSKLLLEAGAALEANTAHGETPLMLAAFAGHAGVVKQLLRGGADSHAISHVSGSTLLHAVVAGVTATFRSAFGLAIRDRNDRLLAQETGLDPGAIHSSYSPNLSDDLAEQTYAIHAGTPQLLALSNDIFLYPDAFEERVDRASACVKAVRNFLHQRASAFDDEINHVSHLNHSNPHAGDRERKVQEVTRGPLDSSLISLPVSSLAREYLKDPEALFDHGNNDGFTACELLMHQWSVIDEVRRNIINGSRADPRFLAASDRQRREWGNRWVRSLTLKVIRLAQSLKSGREDQTSFLHLRKLTAFGTRQNLDERTYLANPPSGASAADTHQLRGPPWYAVGQTGKRKQAEEDLNTLLTAKYPQFNAKERYIKTPADELEEAEAKTQQSILANITGKVAAAAKGVAEAKAAAKEAKAAKVAEAAKSAAGKSVQGNLPGSTKAAAKPVAAGPPSKTVAKAPVKTAAPASVKKVPPAAAKSGGKSDAAQEAKTAPVAASRVPPKGLATKPLVAAKPPEKQTGKPAPTGTQKDPKGAPSSTQTKKPVKSTAKPVPPKK